MEDQIQLSVMHLNDAPRLRQSGIGPSGQGSLAVLRENMRRMMDLCSRQVWLAGLADGSILAAAGFQSIDPISGRAILHLWAGIKPIEEDALRLILQKAFCSLDIYRLELAVTSEIEPLTAILQSTGWRHEGSLRNAAFDPRSQRHHDVMLYSILRPDFGATSTVFVPFSKGVFAISGNREKLQGTDFIRFGDPFRHIDQREAAEQLCLMDSTGRLVKRGEFLSLLVDRPYLPQEKSPDLLIQAAEQAAGYFSGRRTSFDLLLDMDQGSEFQVKVWRKLAEIPFGTTWTYEELAYHLEDIDWTAARKMSRAVGSACGANPFPLLLPCHRVIGKDGKLVGFSSGLDIKEYLLTHEMMGLNE